MSDKPSNPPLFNPLRVEHINVFWEAKALCTDITLRDLFAGMAMQAIIQGKTLVMGGSALDVQAAFAWADAMLAEREKK